MGRVVLYCFVIASMSMLDACSNPTNRSKELAEVGKYEEAIELLKTAQHEHPADVEINSALATQQDALVTKLALDAQLQIDIGRETDAEQIIKQIKAVAPLSPKVQALQNKLEQSRRLQRMLEQAKLDFDQGRYQQAQASLGRIVAEDPRNTVARNLLTRAADMNAEQEMQVPSLAMGHTKVSLEFHELALRGVFEALSHAAGINFIFNKDVRTDQKMSLTLRNVEVEEALHMIMDTQLLKYRLVNDHTVLIYPGGVQGQRENENLVTRNFYLVNVDAKQAMAMVKAITKVKDTYIDERLNLLVVHDTPQVVQLVSRLIDSVDIADPEVMMEVQIMEVSTNTLRELGLSWPTLISYGLPGSGSNGGISGAVSQPSFISADDTSSLRFYVANPAFLARFNGSNGDTKILANPRIRAHNHEKAHIQIGNKVPVFTTTSTVNVGVVSSVSYLDVGLKLDVEPSVYLDDEVSMKVALEVSTVVNQVAGPGGAVAYNVGTRQATTSLRLRDGQTEILAGLINDQDQQTAAGITGLSEIPVFGSLFGVRSSKRDKTEIVLLITPHIVRNISLRSGSTLDIPSGTEASPGAPTVKIGKSANVSSWPSKGAVRTQISQQSVPTAIASDSSAIVTASTQSASTSQNITANTETPPPSSVQTELGANSAKVRIAGPQSVFPGATFSVRVTNLTDQILNESLNFDIRQFTTKEMQPLPISFDLAPRATLDIELTAVKDAGAGEATISLLKTGELLLIDIQSLGGSKQDVPALNQVPQ